MSFLKFKFKTSKAREMKRREHLSKWDKYMKTMKRKESESSKKVRRVRKSCDSNIFKKWRIFRWSLKQLERDCRMNLKIQERKRMILSSVWRLKTLIWKKSLSNFENRLMTLRKSNRVWMKRTKFLKVKN